MGYLTIQLYIAVYETKILVTRDSKESRQLTMTDNVRDTIWHVSLDSVKNENLLANFIDINEKLPILSKY